MGLTCDTVMAQAYFFLVECRNNMKVDAPKCCDG